MLSHIGSLSLARPAALWIGLALLPVVFLYFLRMRFKRKSVGSTFLWRELALPTSGGDALRRRSILLLLLQAAAIALAALAAAGPSLVSRTVVEPGTAFVIDASASMGSRDCPGARGPRSSSRVEAAALAASREIDALGDGIPIMTFACSLSARPLLSGPTLDKAAAKASLRGLAAGSGSFDEGACADAISAWLARAPGAWRARAFTDGGMDLGGERLSAAFRGAFASVIVGTSGESVGVTGFRLEESADGKAKASFTVWNGRQADEELRLRLTRGKAIVAESLLHAAPGWSRLKLDLDGGLEEGGYSLVVERKAGELEGAPGGTCFLSVAARRALSVALVGRSDPFIKAALAQGGASYSHSAEFPRDLASDIVVVDSKSPPEGTRANLLVFGAPPADAPVAANGPASGAIASAGLVHPLTRFVSWEGASAGGGMGYALRGQALVLATTGGKPSIVAWEKDGYRCLACGIDLARSDIGLKSAFPVLLQNYIQWCSPRVDDQSAYTLVVGESARRLEPESFAVRSAEVEATRSGPAVTIEASSAGLFEWEAAGSRGYIAANVPSGELDVAPRALRAGLSAAGDGAAASTRLAAEEKESSRPLGAIVSALLAACLAAEWLAWKGRAGGKA